MLETDAMLVSESDFSLHDRRLTLKLELDYLSHRGDDLYVEDE
jgi:hypothetical protein